MQINKIIILAILLLSLSISKAYSIYECQWLNPKPFGNTLINLHFNGNYGFLVGSGILMKTSDAGSDWTNIYHKNLNFKNVFVVDDEHGFFLANNNLNFENVFIRTSDGANTLEQFTVSQILNSLYFFDEQTGFVCGESGVILKTTNAGENWQNITSGTNMSLRGITFFDENIGYAYGGNNSTTLVLKTTNGGESWSDISPTANHRLENHYIFDDDNIYFVGRNGYILNTTDGGATWNEFNFTTNNILYSILFINENIGFIGGANGIFLQTTDGGTTWNEIELETSVNLYGIHFFNDDDGLIIGQIGTILTTNDGGETWDTEREGPNFWLNSLFYTDNGNIFAVGLDGVILSSNDNGETFNVVRHETENFEWLLTVYFTSNSTGYAAGLNGLMLRTTDGGTEWNELNSGTSNNLNKLVFTDVNNGFAVGDEGIVIKTTNAGDNWSIINLNTDVSLNSIYFLDEQIAYIGGNEVLFKTTDGGEQWEEITIPASTFIKSVFFLNEDIGFCLELFGYITITTNGGSTWERYLVNNESAQLYQVYFIDEFTGFVLQTNGNLFKTKDGGKSWNFIACDFTNSILQDFVLIDNATLLVAGESGSIIKVMQNGLDFPQLIAPDNQSEELEFPIDFSWYPIYDADEYTIQIASDANFNNILVEETISNNNFTVNSLNPRSNYYWRVKAINSIYESIWSETYTFTSNIVAVTLEINLNSGWNLISFNVVAEDLEIETIFEDIEENIAIVKEGSKFYIPGAFNSIGEINLTKAYLVYAMSNVTLEVVGIPINPEELEFSLNTGWNTISYPLQVPKNIELVFDEIEENISIVKSGDGKIYIPNLLNTIGNMQPGAGYIIYSLSAVTFYFEE